MIKWIVNNWRGVLSFIVMFILPLAFVCWCIAMLIFSINETAWRVFVCLSPIISIFALMLFGRIIDKRESVQEL